MEKKQTSKKGSSNLFVYILMLFLLLFIVIPPVLRAFVPKTKENVLEPKKEKIVLLTCNKTSEDQSYQMSSKTKFLNGEATSVTLTYEKKNSNSSGEGSDITQSEVEGGVQSSPDIEGANTNSVAPNPSHSFSNLEAEFEIFRNLGDATVIEDETKFSVTMTPETVASNNSIESLNDYFRLLPNQKKYYEEAGYVCTKVES